jgi:hypothetical protein
MWEITPNKSACGKLITNPFGAIDRRYGNYLPTPLCWFHGRQAKSSRSTDVRVELQNTKTLIGAEPWFRLPCQKSDS